MKLAGAFKIIFLSQYRYSIISYLKTTVNKLFGLSVVQSGYYHVVGRGNIEIKGLLRLGLNYVGFVSPNTRGLLNINGNIKVVGNALIGPGCSIDIAKGAFCKIGTSYITANAKIICQNKIIIGDGCALSWGVELLDSDFHQYIDSNGTLSTLSKAIFIEDDVWVGSNVKVLKGVRIPRGCIIAAGSVVTKSFNEPNCLIGGNPARVIKKDINWKL